MARLLLWWWWRKFYSSLRRPSLHLDLALIRSSVGADGREFGRLGTLQFGPCSAFHLLPHGVIVRLVRDVRSDEGGRIRMLSLPLSSSFVSNSSRAARLEWVRGDKIASLGVE